MSNRLPLRDRLRDHPLFADEDCDECHKYPDQRGLYEYGNKFICWKCYDRHIDEAEAKLEGER